MVDGFAVHRLDYANVVNHLGEVGQGFAEFDATAAMAGEANGGRSDWETGLSRGHRSLAFVGIDGLRDFLAETFFEEWFMVEEIVLGRTS